MSEDLVCPKDNTRLDRKYGLPGVVWECSCCKKEYVVCLGKVITKKEFHEKADTWHN